MRNPIHILLTLVVVAGLAGVVLWAWARKASLTADLAVARAEAAKASGQLADQMARVDEAASEVDRLEQENRELRATIERMENQSGRQGATGADDSSEPPPDEADKGSPEFIAEQVFEIRRLRPREALRFSAVPRDEVNARIRADVLAAATPEEFRAQARALVAMGFVFDEEFEDLAPPLVGLRTNQEAAYHDASSNTILYPDNAPLRNPTERGKLVQEITRALQTQLLTGSDPAAQLQPVPARNWDASLARRALSLGDATQVKIRYNLVDQFDSDVPPPSPESQQQFYDAPVFVREASLFPYFHGAKFVEALQLEGGWDRVDQAYARQPASTAEILHPELYLADPPFEPRTVEFAAPEIAGIAPIWSDVAGEFSIALLLKILIDVAIAEPAAEGWLGDRYAVYANDAIAWKTVWRSADDAAEFAAALTRYLGARHQIPQDKFTADADGTKFRDDAVQVEILHEAGASTVGLLMAYDAAFFDAMTQVLRPSMN